MKQLGTPPAATPPTEHLQRGSLGARDIFFFVVAAAAPLTVMAGVAPLAILIGGIGAPAAYLIAGVILTIFAVGFTSMTKYIHNAGAFYSYITRGLGKEIGLGSAMLAVFSYNAIQIGLYGGFGYFASITAKDLIHLTLPWWLWAAAGILIVTLLGYRSINVGAKVLAVMLTAEVGVLCLLAAAILLRGPPHGYSAASFAPSHVATSGMGSVLAIAFGAFIGFEATAIYREEARKPNRTIPRATYAAVGFLGVFYAFITWIIIQGFGNAAVLVQVAKNPAGLFFSAMTTYVGTWASDLMRVLIVTSLLAALLAFHNAITRYCYALSSEGVFSKKLGSIHPRHHSPYIAGFTQSILAAVVVAGFALAHADPYTKLLLWVDSPGVIGIIILQSFAAAAVFAFFWRDRRGESAIRTLIAPAVASVLLAGAAVLTILKIGLLTGAGPAVNVTLIATIPVVFIGGVAYALWLRRSKPDIYQRIATTDIDTEELQTV